MIDFSHETNYRGKFRLDFKFDSKITSHICRKGGRDLFVSVLYCVTEKTGTKNWSKKVGLIKRKNKRRKKAQFFLRQRSKYIKFHAYAPYILCRPQQVTACFRLQSTNILAKSLKRGSRPYKRRNKISSLFRLML